MADADVVRMPEQLPELVRVDPSAGIRFTPNQLRALKAETGRTMTDLLGEDGDDEDRMQAMVWLELRRQGKAVPWDRCGDVALEFTLPTPDPTTGGSSTESPRSAGSGG